MSTLPLLPLVCALSPALAGGPDDPFADRVISYLPGANPVPGFTDASTALGSPERFTGEGVFPGVVSAFNPPFGLDEIVSIGIGGELVVCFDTPVTDDPANPFGLDLLIFSNAFFPDASYPMGIVGGGLFADLRGVVEVSADGRTWHEVTGVTADGLFPTQGWLDAGPYDAVPGSMPSSFTWPVDPGLAAPDLDGLHHAEVTALYNRSGGGRGIDLASVGLSAISCVRITNPGDAGVDPALEIDAVSDVAPDVGPADVDRDGVVGVLDFLLLLSHWGPCAPGAALCPADINGNGAVDTVDLLELLQDWTL